MSYQKCPICNGTGNDPISGTTSSTQPRCLVCDGRRIISTKTGLPPNRVSIEQVKEMSKLLKDSQLNYAAEEHMRKVIDELDKTGELPYHIRPTNPLKRTEEEKDEIRMERFMDASLRKIDDERGRDIFDSLYIKLSKEDEEKHNLFEPVEPCNADIQNAFVCNPEYRKADLKATSDAFTIYAKTISTQNPTQDVSNIQSPGS